MQKPFNEGTLYDHDPLGRWVVTLSRSTPAGERGRFVLTRRSTTGGIVWTRTVSYRPVPITRAIMNDTVGKYTSELLQMEPASEPYRDQIAAAVREAIGDARYLPGATDVVSAHDGSTWVRVGSTGPRVMWMVFDQEGRHRANLVAPSGMSLMAADAQRVWGVLLDQDDVPRIIRYRIRQ